MMAIFGENAIIRRWLQVEQALTQAQGDVGLRSPEQVEAIVEAIQSASIDNERLWQESRNVGYPILPLIRILDEEQAGVHQGLIHVGATTQDIMDCTLALDARDAGFLILEHVNGLGDALANMTREHAGTAMVARTHAQQAVPTTFGAKCAVFLDELVRHRQRLLEATNTVGAVSFFGAAGTSAASGPHSVAVRVALATRLNLQYEVVPWHVARDRIGSLASVTVLISQMCARLARELIDLSRTEIAEVAERFQAHRGASSTMPQKRNPILGEAVLGLSIAAAGQLPALLRAHEAGHERAAGEWQVEWHVFPQIMTLASSAVMCSAELIQGLRVFPDQMRLNLEKDTGLVMAEAYMIHLANALGGSRAHEVVYEAAASARLTGRSLHAEILTRLPADIQLDFRVITPDEYLGETSGICDEAVTRWTRSRAELESEINDR